MFITDTTHYVMKMLGHVCTVAHAILAQLIMKSYLCVVSYSIPHSIDKASKISSPVLVIHGTEDEVIDFSHGLEMYEKCPHTVEPLWVEGAGHNDVELYGQYLERLKNFITTEIPPPRSV